MKILIADDEPTVRRIMRAFLEKHKYEVEAVDCGRKAIEMLTAEGAPHVAIVDWMMPDLTGPEVCAKLRQARLRIRPYLLILTSKNTEADLAAGLDAGADDFLTKPFKTSEMLARLRVAERTVAYAIEVQQQIERLEELVERHQLLGEMIAKAGQAAGAPAPGAPAAAASSVTETAPTAPGLALALEEVEAQTVRALGELGLEAVATNRETPARTRSRITYSAWIGFVHAQSQTWTDLLFEAEPAAVHAIFTRTFNRAPHATHCQSFMVEALNVVGSSLRELLQSRAVEILVPFLAQGQQIDRTLHQLTPGERATTHYFDLSGCAFTLTVGSQPCPLQAKTTRQLRRADILAESYPPAGAADVALLNRSAALNDHYIEILQAYGETTAECHPVPVFEPTGLARFFCLPVAR